MTDQNTRPTPSNDVEGIARRNMRETYEAMVAMRDTINEYVPMPSLESDLLTGPESSVFCSRVAESVVAHIVSLSKLSYSVRPLEWVGSDALGYEANCVTGTYHIATNGGTFAWSFDDEDAWHHGEHVKSAQQAKEEAQRHFDAAIRSALAPAQVEVTDEMVRVYKDAYRAHLNRWLENGGTDTGDGTEPSFEATRAGLTAALTATDAKPVVPAEPVAGERLRKAAERAQKAMAEYYRYFTGGETRGSYDGKPERRELWAAKDALYSALASEGKTDA